MVIKGLSTLIIGMCDYSGMGNKSTYSEPATVAKMVEYSPAINRSEDNPLYTDDMDTEHDKGTFQNGKLLLTADDLTQETSKKVLGIRTEEFTYSTDKSATEGIHDDKRVALYLGIGVIEAHQNNDITKYRAVLLPKVLLSVPEQTATTKGEPIEWQIPTVTGTVMCSDLIDDKYEHPWMMDAWFQTRVEAILHLEYKCEETDAQRRQMDMRIPLLSIEGKTYPFVLSLNAAKQVENEYIPVTKMVDCLLEPEKFKENSMGLVKDIVYIMICEGIQHCSREEIKQQDGKELTPDIPNKKSLYADIGYGDSGILTKAMYSTFAKSRKKEPTTKRKKVERELTTTTSVYLYGLTWSVCRNMNLHTCRSVS